jgi:hypothetical protein
MTLIQRVQYWLLVATAFFAGWGDVLRLGTTTREEGTQLGITTISVLTLVFIGTVSGNLFRGWHKAPLNFACYLVFLFMAVFATLQSPEEGTIAACGNNVAYFLLAGIVAGTELNDKQKFTVLLVFAFSIGLSSIASVVDYLGIVDFPRINERTDHIEDLDRGLNHNSLCGPFYSRTILGIYLSLALPIAFASTFFLKNRRLQIASAITLVVLTITALLSGSRGLLLVFPVLLLYLLTAHSGALIRNLIVIGCVLVVTSTVALIVYPPMVDLVSSQLSRLSYEEVSTSDSDLVRYYTLQVTVAELSESPLGMGFTQVPIPGGTINPHSNPVMYLRAGGLLGILLILVFYFPMFKKMISRDLKDIDRVLVVTLISFNIYGLTHTTVGTAYFWICLGLLYSGLRSVSVRHASSSTSNKPQRLAGRGFPILNPTRSDEPA